MDFSTCRYWPRGHIKAFDDDSWTSPDMHILVCTRQFPFDDKGPNAEELEGVDSVPWGYRATFENVFEVVEKLLERRVIDDWRKVVIVVHIEEEKNAQELMCFLIRLGGKSRKRLSPSQSRGDVPGRT